MVGTVSVKDTDPAKPFTAVTVIMELVDTPALTEAGEVAVIVMSCTV